MKSLKAMWVLFLILFASGCQQLVNDITDYSPPAPPTGLWTETGDNFIELFWNKNRESDVAGYNVFVSGSYNGRYDLIGSVRTPYFKDTGARNGATYYYAVTAYDYDGNESELSRDVIYDVPRPEGYGVVLDDYRRVTATSGYDFSRYAVVPYNDLYADMYFENYQGTYYMNVRSDTDIQDMGPTNSILDIREAPNSGWSPTRDVQLIPGHTYVVWTWDDHYAKFRVSNISPSRVTFDWAYQLQKSNPMLKAGKSAGGERTAVHSDHQR
ncbi:hypothetical protein FBQ87_14865 [Sphingobacteriales bacterium CHB3]|nr:hypothetical protein [Sphingobacteriales bacterium CHB3]